ncbi:MAG TPA: polymer-forming cytoskeletal protein [Burkholderiales bacterium]|nr:polymer-forming cytoskeletal protein [Burkholderiales bacterium]
MRGDLIAAGGELRVTAPVAGDLVVAGGSVRLDGAVEHNVYAAGGQVGFDGAAARNARIAGGSVAIGPRARIGGNASLAGGQVEMRGSIGGYLQAGAGHVLIDGPVAGDVDASAGDVELGPRARIAGKLRYRAKAPLNMDPAAQVAGGVERLELPRHPTPPPRWLFRAGFVIWSLGLVVLAAVLAWLLPAFSARVADNARRRFGWSLLTGFVALVAVPPAVLVLMVTVVGLPLAILTALAYAALMLVGYVASGIAIGNAALARWQAERAAHTGWRVAAAAAGTLILSLVALIPWLGGLVAFLALLAGIGALLLELRTAVPAAARA